MATGRLASNHAFTKPRHSATQIFERSFACVCACHSGTSARHSASLAVADDLKCRSPDSLKGPVAPCGSVAPAVPPSTLSILSIS